MIDLVCLWAGAASIGCGTLTYLHLRLRIDRDELRADLNVERNVAKALENRVTNLRADNIALEREVGRLRAQLRLFQPKRDPSSGKFIPKQPH
jgi:hypothetical protein